MGINWNYKRWAWLKGSLSSRRGCCWHWSCSDQRPEETPGNLFLTMTAGSRLHSLRIVSHRCYHLALEPNKQTNKQTNKHSGCTTKALRIFSLVYYFLSLSAFWRGGEHTMGTSAGRGEFCSSYLVLCSLTPPSKNREVGSGYARLVATMVSRVILAPPTHPQNSTRVMELVLGWEKPDLVIYSGGESH